MKNRKWHIHRVDGKEINPPVDIDEYSKKYFNDDVMSKFKYMQLAHYKCKSCNYEWKQKPSMLHDGCPKCGHLYVDWINYNKESAPEDVKLIK